MNDFILQRIWHRKKSVPFYKEATPTDGAFCAIAMLAGYHGRSTDVRTFKRRYAQLLNQNLSIQNVVDILSDQKFLTQSVRVTAANFRSLELPCIILWEGIRFAVLVAIKGDNFVVYDPRHGAMTLSQEMFARAFGGIAITASLAGSFEQDEKVPELKLFSILKQMRGLGPSFQYLILISFAVFGLTMVVPYYSMWVMDEALAKRDLSLLHLVLIAGLFVMTVKGITELLRDRILLALGNSFVMQFSQNLIQHLLRLPLSYFEQRNAATILKRIEGIEEVKVILSERLMVSFFDILMLASSAVLLCFYSLKLTGVIVATAVLSILARVIFFPAYRKHRTEVLNLDGEEQGNLLETVRAMQSIKLYSIEATRLNLWSDISIRKLGSHIASQKQTTYWRVFDDTINAIQGVVLIWLGAKSVLDGSLTIGVLMSCIEYKGRVNQKMTAILEAWVDFKVLAVHLSRLADITMESPEAERDSGGDGMRLTGALEVRNLDFRYSPRDPLLFNGLHLKLDVGDSIAIIGPSGSGKSTLLKLMLGLIEPSNGDVLADRFPITKIQSNYRRNVATVMQDDCILSGTIMDNITFYDRNPDIEKMKRSADFACILEDIMKMPMGFQTLVSDYSSTISGGQKQRILIARAIYRQPRIIFMDEATSALDVTNEKRVNDGMKKLGITRVVVAHRPATILSADKIYRLEEGRLVLQDRDSLGLSA